jgi:hypothetical protein
MKQKASSVDISVQAEIFIRESTKRLRMGLVPKEENDSAERDHAFYATKLLTIGKWRGFPCGVVASL